MKLKSADNHKKVKMFLLLLFAAIAIVYIAQVARLSIDGFRKIDSNYDDFVCAKFNYEILDVIYDNNKLTLDLLNNDNDANISKVIIKPDTSGNYPTELVPPLKAGEGKIITIDNISIDRGFNLSLNDCPSKYTTLK